MEKVVGLLPAPELPEKKAMKLKKILPQYFKENIDKSVDWKIDVRVNPLVGAAEASHEITDEAEKERERQNWDYAICITDLPLSSKNNVLLAVSNNKVAYVSLPAFGLLPMRMGLKEVIIQMGKDIHLKDSNRGKPQKEQKRERFTLFKSKIIKLFSPIRRENVEKEKMSILEYSIFPKINGKLRILLGMVIANRPWTIFSSFTKVIAVAFATGAYALFFTSVWSLSVAYQPMRFIWLMVSAIGSMVLWIILIHGLWEKPSQRSKDNMRRLYNITSVFTLSVAVIFYYITLFALMFVAVKLFVPPDLFGTKTGLGGAATLSNYLHLTWLITSIATLAGAIGAGLENEELVRNSTYGYRQKKRYKQMQQEQQ